MIRKLLRYLKLHPKSIILITIPDAGNLICDKRSTELFILMIVIGFLFPLERFNSRAQMIACGSFFSSLPIQKLSIVVDKAGSPAVFQQFKAQSLRIIAVLLHIAVFGFHPRLLVAAVISELPNPCKALFFYYTTLSIISKPLCSFISHLLHQLVLLIIEIMELTFFIRLPNAVSRPVISIANRSAVSPLFQKLSPDIIPVGNIQSAAAQSNAATGYCRHLISCLRCPVPISVILVGKGQQRLIRRSCFQTAEISIPIVGIRGGYPLSVMNVLYAVQRIIAITHLQSAVIVDAAPPAQKVIFITGAYPRRIPDLRHLPCLVIGIGNQALPARALLLQPALFIVNILIGMPVAHRTAQSAQTVVMPCADTGILPLRIGCLLINGLTEHVADAL